MAVATIPRRTTLTRRTFRIHPDQWRRVEELAAESDVSISQALRVLLDRALQQEAQ
jgi:hypothetical protein